MLKKCHHEGIRKQVVITRLILFSSPSIQYIHFYIYDNGEIFDILHLFLFFQSCKCNSVGSY